MPTRNTPYPMLMIMILLIFQVACGGGGGGYSSGDDDETSGGNESNDGGNTNTGEATEADVIWQSSAIGASLEASPAVDASNNVYIVTDQGTYSFDSTGQSRWTESSATGLDGSIVSISPDNNFVYVPGESISKLSTSDGSVVWSVQIGSEIFGTVIAIAPNGETVYVGAGDGFDFQSNNFYALNADNGDIKWTYVETSTPQQEDNADLRGHLGGAILDADGNIYISNQHGYLVSLTDGGDSATLNWKFPLGAEPRMPASIAGDYIYQTSNSGVVHKINKATGVEVTSGQYPALGNVGEVFTPIAFSNDGSTFYVNAEDMYLYALDTETGSVNWRYRFDDWGSDPLVRQDGAIIVMCEIEGSARVCAISDDGTSGSLLWRSETILSSLPFNETSVNIANDGTIYVHAGDEGPLVLSALRGNGSGISSSAPWPKFMGSMQNNGSKITE